ncbi:hypothetical protein [Arthrobacter sp. JSM 101049]|uniref:hypothetical protein n=1 Tax=Arthrobacter sp. JSM 101049 TaxID=929097 RepID=UPI003561E15C
MKRTRHRRTHALSAVAATALALLALSGCAGEEDGSGPTTPTASTVESAPATGPVASAPAAGPAEGADADLSITLTSNGTDASHRYQLVCVNGSPGQGTDHPQADAACTFLSGPGKSVLTGTPEKGAQCTQESAGPQTAIVEGTLNGSSVQRGFSLTNGCKIATWKSAEALLGRGTSNGTQ